MTECSKLDGVWKAVDMVTAPALLPPSPPIADLYIAEASYPFEGGG